MSQLRCRTTSWRFIISLIVETLLTWEFYGARVKIIASPTLLTSIEYLNRNNSNVVSNTMMILVSILNSGRNSLPLVFLLNLSMGHEAVKPSLTGIKANVRWLTGSYFIVNFIYSNLSLGIIPERISKSTVFTCGTTC